MVKGVSGVDGAVDVVVDVVVGGVANGVIVVVVDGEVGVVAVFSEGFGRGEHKREEKIGLGYDSVE